MMHLKRLPRTFVFYQLAVFLLLLTNQATRLALGWWALGADRSAATFGILIAAGSAAEVGSQLLFSWMGDRFNKPRLILLTNGLTAAALIILIVGISLAQFSFWILVTGMLLSGCAAGIRGPVQQSLLPQLVKKEILGAAIQVRSTLSTVATFLGPLLATSVLTTVGPRMAVTGSLFFLIVASVCVSRIESTGAVKDGFLGHELHKDRWWIQLWLGVVALFHIRMEFFLALLAAAINFSLYPFLTFVLLAIVKSTTGEAWIYGMLDAAFGLGLLFGAALIVGPLNKLLGRARSVVLGFLALALPLLASGFGHQLLVTYVGMPVNVAFIALTPLFFIGGCGLMLININANIVRSLAVPEKFRTRILGAVAFLSGIAMPVGSVVAGSLLSWVSPATVAVLLGLIVALCAPLSAIIPDITKIMNKRDEELDGEYARIYPTAFARRP